MKRCLPLAPALVAGLWLCAVSTAAGPQSAAATGTQARLVPFPVPPAVSSRAYLVQNAVTGEVIAAKGDRRRLPIASITKLMTAIVALEHAAPSARIVVTRAAAEVEGSQAGLYAGQEFSVRELVEAALVPSANDAADALADGITKGRRSVFVRWMNEKAQALGMTDTRFLRPEGLDAPGQASSARDVAILLRAALARPLIAAALLRREIRIDGRRLLSRNDLLRTFPGMLGGKTGTTTKAGWSLAAAAKRDAVRVLVVSLGSPNRGARNRDLETLLRWGLDRYRTVRALDPSRVYAKSRLTFGRAPLDLVVQRPVWRVVHTDLPLVERIVAPAVIEGAVTRGQRIGEVRVYAGSRLVASAPLVAGRTAASPSAAGRVGDYARSTAHHLWSWVS